MSGIPKSANPLLHPSVNSMLPTSCALFRPQHRKERKKPEVFGLGWPSFPRHETTSTKCHLFKRPLHLSLKATLLGAQTFLKELYFPVRCSKTEVTRNNI